jgi:hypothetical protein
MVEVNLMALAVCVDIVRAYKTNTENNILNKYVR